MPFHIDAWVVLPEHLHCLWTLPEGDADFPGRWQAIKTAFTKSLPTGEARTPVMLRRGERGVWQRRYWEHTIRDERDYATHMDYITTVRSKTEQIQLVIFCIIGGTVGLQQECRLDRHFLEY